MIHFLKGIVAGIGGVSPGLSGSVLLILLGLYHQTLEALGTLLTRFKSNLRFLLPIVLGLVTGVLLFSKVIDFCLTSENDFLVFEYAVDSYKYNGEQKDPSDHCPIYIKFELK